MPKVNLYIGIDVAQILKDHSSHWFLEIKESNSNSNKALEANMI